MKSLVSFLRLLPTRLEKRTTRRLRMYGAVARMNGMLRARNEAGLEPTAEFAQWWFRNSGRLLALDERWHGSGVNADLCRRDCEVEEKIR
jgi:hypothetical protein